MHVVDLTTGQEVPSQVVTVGGSQYLRVQAPAVPSVGYKVFEIRPGAGQTFANSPTANASTGVIENEYYRLTVSPRGAITSFVDKRMGNREFAGNTGGFALNDLGAASGSLAVENAGPVSVTLRATSSSPLSHTTRITLTRGSDRAAIQNEITQNFGGTREWRFSFNAPSPEVRHEEVGAVLLAKLTTQGGAYSPHERALRLPDPQSLRRHERERRDRRDSVQRRRVLHAARQQQRVRSLDTSTPQLSVLAGGSLRPCNPILNQAGDSLSSPALRAPVARALRPASRDAVRARAPEPTRRRHRCRAAARIRASSYSYLSVSDPNVLLWSLKPAEEGIGEGVIARVWNLTGSPKPFSISLNEPIARAKSVTHIETDRGDATVSGGSRHRDRRAEPAPVVPAVPVVACPLR